MPGAATSIVDGLAGADAQSRAALLQAGSVAPDERLRAELRRALAGPDASLRLAAARALWETRDPGLLPDLLNFARQASDLGQRVPAVRGYVRLVSDTENVRPSCRRTREGAPADPPSGQGRGKVGRPGRPGQDGPTSSALALALSMLDDPATRAEAAQAVTSIASALGPTRHEHARMGLEKVLAGRSRIRPAPGGARGPAADRPERGHRLAGERSGASRWTAPSGAKAWPSRTSTRTAISTSPRATSSTWGRTGSRSRCSAAAKEYDPENYSDEFLCFAEDIDRDGWLDLIVVGFPGAKTRWLRNPGRRGGPWKEFLAIEKTGNESPDWVDVFKDGRKELVFVSEQGMAFASPGADPTKPWPIRVIAAPATRVPATAWASATSTATAGTTSSAPRAGGKGPPTRRASRGRSIGPSSVSRRRPRCWSSMSTATAAPMS